MSELAVQLGKYRARGSEGGAEVTAAELEALIKSARNARSAGGTKISYAELSTLFSASQDAKMVKYAIGQLGLTVTDLRGIYDEMLKDGKIGEAELRMLFEAAISPKNHAEAGASVSTDEVSFFNSLDKLDRDAKSLFDRQVAPRLSAMLDGPARQAGVKVKSATTDELAPILPRGPRNPVAPQMLESRWLDPTSTSGFGSSTVRIAPASFVINNATPSSGWYSDGVERYGSWQNGDTGVAKISQMPADGQLHFTLLAHPSGHHDHDGGTNSWGFSRDNVYYVRVRMPDGKVYAMDDIRNSPHGARDNKLGARGNEEYVTMQDLSIDASKLKAGDKIRIEMWPSGTSAYGYSTNRIFDLVLPDDWKPVR